MNIVTTTYPVYLFARAVTQGVAGVQVQRLNTGQTSCLHDYTLSVEDMKKLEGADVIALNGVELEEFMQDALAVSTAQVIDCSVGVELLENLAHDHEAGEENGHDHGHYDPHIWMDPSNAAIMVSNIQTALISLDPEREQAYRDNGQGAWALLNAWDAAVRELLSMQEGADISGLVTFHDGFGYFAHAFELPLLAAIEEEAGSEASAKEIVEITQLVKQRELPVIFTEVNGSDATARAISRETGCAVAQLSMIMDGPEDGVLSDYFNALMDNAIAIVNGFAGEELIQ